MGETVSSKTTSKLISNTLFFDLECGEDNGVYALGAILRNNAPIVARNAEQVRHQMPVFRDWVRSAQYLCGHNIIAHDLPLLEKLHGPEDYADKIIDTLYLSPIAYPTRPYHSLTKEDKLVRESRNDPVEDSRSCKKLLADCCNRFAELSEDERELYSCAFELAELNGIARLFRSINLDIEIVISKGVESQKQQLLELFKQLNEDRCCLESIEVIEGGNGPLVLAYIHAWLQSAAGSSTIPYWICHQIPEIRPYLRKLRADPCQSPECKYCRNTHNPTKALQKYFQFPSFRPVPEVMGRPGQSLQEAIVSNAMLGQSLLGILPTGGGKSLCFQIPALHRYEATGALSIVISPLQSLMRDQVENLKNRGGIQHTAALYGLLTPVERKYCLKDIRMGHVGLLYVSPEQLRSKAFKRAIACREIAYWIFDEAHCLSKWGHDFRVDYLYASKFIKRLADEQSTEPPPVLCVTATAKEAVKEELIEHFRERLKQELVLLDGGTGRSNLKYRVEAVAGSAKEQRLRELLEDFYGTIPEGDNPIVHDRFARDCIQKGAIVIFAATRKRVMDIYEGLARLGWPILPFHGGLKDEEMVDETGKEAGLTKKYVLEQFLSIQKIPIIVATNAFGMGVDKPDIRKVIHADATGSLENYLQEAGRAGRDGEPAECILLYETQDLETQFAMNFLSQISLRDLQKIWNTIYASKPDSNGMITISTEEISDKLGAGFSLLSDSPALDDTQIKAAINILEDQEFLERTENQSRVFEARLMVNNLDEAREKIHRARVPIDVQKLWIAVIRLFLDARADEKIMVQHLAELDEMQTMYERLNAHGERVRSLTTLVFRTLNSMAAPEVGLLKKDMLYSARIQPKAAFSSMDLLEQHESAVLKEIEESFPDQDDTLRVSIKRQNEILLRHGVSSSPRQIKRVFYYLSRDNEWLGRRHASMKCIESHGGLNVRFEESFEVYKELSMLRLNIAREVLKLIVSGEPAQSNGKSSIFEFREADVLEVLKERYANLKQTLYFDEALQYILMWLHENEVISLQQGKALITTSLTIQLVNEGKHEGRKKRFNKGHFEAQTQHYKDRTLQVHIVGEYANQAIGRGDESHIKFIEDYFKMERITFVQKYFTTKEQQRVLELATGIDSYNRIVESLNKNQVQKEVVMSDGYSNDMVLAGPGSGKTMVIAHRCAWLLRVRRVKRASIVVLCFNRHAALELRQRIWHLVGNDAAGVIIQTFHGLALRLLGRTMAQIDTEDENHGLSFEEIIPEAINLLEGKTMTNDMDADAWRQRLLGNLSHILVDEYQDIDATAYKFISLLAGKSAQESENKLKILAVGDDDQSIYKFAGANVEYIRRFQKDYADLSNQKSPTPVNVHHMVENYRSTRHIITAANAIISKNQDRMKTAYPIKIDALRTHEPAGGVLEDLDPETNGKVQIIRTESFLYQAYACVDEIKRYLSLSAQHQPEHCCVVARTNADLVPVRIALEQACIPCSVVGSQAVPNLSRVREINKWLELLQRNEGKLWSGKKVYKQMRKKLGPEFLESSIGRTIEQIGAEFYGENHATEMLCEDVLDYFYDALFEQKRKGFAGRGVMLATGHKVKGLEFENVLVLDGDWMEYSRNVEKREEARRLFYVAMTRARKSLTLFQSQGSSLEFIKDIPCSVAHRRESTPIVQDLDLLNYRYEVIDLDDLYMSYAARFKPTSQEARSLNRLKIGDNVNLQLKESKGEFTHVFLTNQYGVNLVRLSKKGVAKWLPRLKQIHQARLSCLHTRHRDDGNGDNKNANRVWYIPIIEVLYKAENKQL